ncbi:MAG: hypothetical protein HN356_08600 [Calditrichaeota bacterium]|jgi:hypothetical protein|nr:hypothetical protein [Calditrichota bacterium]MBT7618833.1 hypothetical protein [Calditrichota bacterium]MBT7790391.1 hypothetical protein [Calditrichota bacterium]
MKGWTTYINLPTDWVRKLLTLVAAFFLLGSIWVWKEHFHNILASRLIAAEITNRSLYNDASNLELDLAQSTEYVRISKKAEQLGMICQKYPADTLWVATVPEKLDYRVISMFHLSLRSR